MKIVTVASEAAPFVRHAGPADIIGSLVRAIAGRGHDVALFLPAYRDLVFPEGARRETAVAELRVPGPQGVEPASLVRVTLPGEPRLEVLLVQHHGDRRFFERPGAWIEPASGEPYGDNPARYAFFGRAVIEGLRALGRSPDVLHALDARAAWTLALLRRRYAAEPNFVRTATLASTFDLADQEAQPAATLAEAGIEEDAQDPWAKHRGDAAVPLLKVGIRHADFVALPSARFAQDVREDHTLALGLAGVLAARAKDTLGIVPGIDTVAWDPASDATIASAYGAHDPGGKAACRRALAERAGWPTDPAESGHAWPLVGMIARLDDASGLDLVDAAMHRLLAQPMRLFVLGLGERRHHERLRELAQAFPERLFARLTFDDGLVREILAGADLLLVPQKAASSARQAMRSLRYGTPPIVHAAGAHADVVCEFDPETGEGNGFHFTRHDADDLVDAVGRAIEATTREDRRLRLMRNALATDVSYAPAAEGYERAYGEAMRKVEANRFQSWALGLARNR